jgi:hypothetical protein
MNDASLWQLYGEAAKTSVVFGFGVLNPTPQGGRRTSHIAQFAIDYTFFMNMAFAGAAVVLVGLNRGWKRHEAPAGGHSHQHHGSGISAKRMLALTCAAVVAAGLLVYGLTGGTA